MKARSPHPVAAPRRASPGFSLMELLLAVGIMGVIVGALYGMFHHTQRALRSNLTQVDVLEGGRSVMEVLTRQLTQVVPSRVPGAVNLMFRRTAGYQPLVQPLMTGNTARTNVLFELFFLSRYDRDYEGTLYRVLDATNGVGTLARVSTNFPSWQLNNDTLAWMFSSLLARPPQDYVPLAEGVVHFRIDAYDGDGWPFNRERGAWMMLASNRVYYPQVSVYIDRVTGTNVYFRNNVVLQPGTDSNWPNEIESAYLDTALPASLDVELALLESKANDQYKALGPGSPLASRFLANKAAQVHLFRQRIPLRQAPAIQAVHP